MRQLAIGLLALLLPVPAAAPQARTPAEEAAGAAAAPRPVLTLDQCLQEALANGPGNRILQAGLDASRAQHAATVSQNTFNLRGTLGYNYRHPFGSGSLAGRLSPLSAAAGAVPGAQAGLALTGPLTSLTLNASPYVEPTVGGNPASALGLGFSQTLWNGYPGGTAKAAVEKSRIALQIKELATAADRANLVYQVRQAYFTVLSAQQNLAVQQEILDQQASLLRQITAVYNLQQASTVDLQTAQVNARTAEINLRSAEHDLRLARIRLANLMNRPPDQPFSVAAEEAPRMPALTLAESIREGLSRRSDIRQVDLNRRSLAIDLALARGQLLPNVSVTVGLDGILDWTGEAGWQASAGLRLALPVFDSGAARHLSEANRKQDELYAIQEEQLRRSIAADIQEAYEALLLQLERVEVAQLNADTLALQFKLVQTENRFGTATNQDLFAASVDAADARTALALAKSNAQLAALRLQNVMGY